MRARGFLRIGAALFGAILILAGCSALGAGAVPYADHSAVGYIGLCDKDGKPIDHGSVKDSPFVWAAAASAPATGFYAGDGKTATLFAFQPRQGYPPEDWSGDQLTASTYYRDAAHPMVIGMASDGDALNHAVTSYPPQWQGLMELRMLLGVPGESINSASYAATDIQITGDTWKVVKGGNVACNLSNATLTMGQFPADAPAGSAGSASAGASSAAGAGPGQASPGGQQAGSAKGSTDTAHAGTPTTSATDAGGTSASGPPSGAGHEVAVGLVALAILIVVGGGLAVVWLRRRRAAETPPP